MVAQTAVHIPAERNKVLFEKQGRNKPVILLIFPVFRQISTIFLVFTRKSDKNIFQNREAAWPQKSGWGEEVRILGQNIYDWDQKRAIFKLRFEDDQKTIIAV